MTDTHAESAWDWRVVETDAGSVTLAPVTALQARAAQWRDWATKAAATAQSWRVQAEESLATAGSTLVARSSEWAVPSELGGPCSRPGNC